MKVNEEFFDQINSEVKAYLLGFLLADGCIKQPKGNRQLNLVLSIQEEDSNICKLLVDNVAPFNSMNIYHSPSKKAKGEKPLCIVTITSNKLCNRLIELGCNINKTVTGIKFPTYRGILLRHFIRGYFDGNGGISIRNRKYTYKRITSYKLDKSPMLEIKRYSIFFCSTDLSFITTLKDVLKVDKGYITSKATKNLTTYTLNYDTASDVTSILTMLYNDCTYKLDRKFQKFDMLIKSQAKTTVLEGLETT